MKAYYKFKCKTTGRTFETIPEINEGTCFGCALWLESREEEMICRYHSPSKGRATEGGRCLENKSILREV